MIRTLPLLLLAPAAFAATAILECTGSSNAGSRHSFFFRTAVIEAWTVERATLLLHVRAGDAPKTVIVSVQAGRAGWRGQVATKPRRAPAVSEPNGWIKIEVPPDFVQGMAVDPNRQLVVEIPKGIELDGKQPGLLSPYLVVEGAPAARQARNREVAR